MTDLFNLFLAGLIAISFGFILGFFWGEACGMNRATEWWRRCAHEGKEHRVGQDVYRVEYVRSEPKEWK